MTLLPWDHEKDCDELIAGAADAVFGVAAPARAKPRRQLLGIRIELKDKAVHVVQVSKGSVAETADLRAGDVITEIAGQPVKRNSDVIMAVRRQAPGTWLPLKVKRQDELIEILAKFPPLKP
jgi:S1-C subfamily serine protease